MGFALLPRSNLLSEDPSPTSCFFIVKIVLCRCSCPLDVLENALTKVVPKELVGRPGSRILDVFEIKVLIREFFVADAKRNKFVTGLDRKEGQLPVRSTRQVSRVRTSGFTEKE